MNLVGIMQGRLLPPEDHQIQSFPRARWEEEFPLASAAKFGYIEWVYDLLGEDVNPLGTASGVFQMRELSARHRVALRSVCADYFMDKPLIGCEADECEKRICKLEWLLVQCGALGISRVVLPFVDRSAMTNRREISQAVKAIQKILPASARLGVEIHLETSLEPSAFKDFLALLPSPFVKVNYDSGNSASLGYRPHDELAAYGKRIGSVHIKDRKLGGGTVPLGEGDTDFVEVFRGLERLRYKGDFTFQTARGPAGKELEWAKKNRQFFEKCWTKASEWI